MNCHKIQIFWNISRENFVMYNLDNMEYIINLPSMQQTVYTQL